MASVLCQDQSSLKQLVFLVVDKSKSVMRSTLHSCSLDGIQVCTSLFLLAWPALKFSCYIRENRVGICPSGHYKYHSPSQLQPNVLDQSVDLLPAFCLLYWPNVARLSLSLSSAGHYNKPTFTPTQRSLSLNAPKVQFGEYDRDLQFLPLLARMETRSPSLGAAGRGHGTECWPIGCEQE